MKTSKEVCPDRGFALLLTLSLLALLVLVLLALTTLVKVDTQLAVTSVYQIQARQNAMVGLSVALGQLQQFAGPDNSLTGTADIVPSSKDVNSRWTGVWLTTDSTPRWLVSGDVNPITYTPAFTFDPLTGSNRKVVSDPTSVDVVLVGNGSVNTTPSSSTGDKYIAGDAVVVPKVAIPSFNSAGIQYTSGDYAYWVGDEGVKLSAALPGIGAPLPPTPPLHEVAKITKNSSDGWTPDSTQVQKVVSYEQLFNAGAGTTTKLKNTFHGLTLVHIRYTDYPNKRAGMINVNSAAPRLWRGVLATFDPGSSKLTNFAAAMSDRAALWAPAGSDKLANGPFQTVAGFLVSNPQVTDAIVNVNKGGAVLPLFQDRMQPLFTVRSDTFRIRAYGDALNPVADPGQPGKIEATAYCEAIVQRVKDSETGDGRFVITYFRWLGPDDI